MSTVASRTFRSSPQRDSVQTWEAIVDLLTKGQKGAARDELLSVKGIASSIIAEHGPEGAAITITCDGPRTRIYCLYDEDAIDGDGAKEDALAYDPLKGNWMVSLPCPEDELAWVQKALVSKSTRITARDKAENLGGNDSSTANTQEAELDLEAFLKS